MPAAPKASGAEPGRGREARSPAQIPRAGWRDILLRVYDEQSRDNISLIAAGVAFYALLAIPPALAAALTLYGLVSDPQLVEQQIQALSGILPGEAQSILRDQLTAVAGASGGNLTLGLVVSLLFALWSASAGTRSVMTAVNIAYDEQEQRSFLVYTAWSVLLTLGGILGLIATLLLVVVLPAILDTIAQVLGLGAVFQWVISLVRWPLLALGVIAGLAVLYRYGPSRRRAQWQWVTWGSGAATAVWLLASIGFSVYVRNFGSYQETYGALGAVVILLMWLYLSAYIVLLGAELNAEIEHQTAVDSTRQDEDSPRPLGERGAHVADTVGRRP